MANKEDKTPEEASNLFHNIMKASVTSKLAGQEKYKKDYRAKDGTLYAILIERSSATQFRVKAFPYNEKGELSEIADYPLNYLRASDENIEVLFEEAIADIDSMTLS